MVTGVPSATVQLEPEQPAAVTVAVPDPAGVTPAPIVTWNGVTWTVNVSERVAPCGSVTVTVIVDEPTVCVGVTVTLRLPPEPPKVMPELGTTAVLDELPDRVSGPPPDSTSATMKLAVTGV